MGEQTNLARQLQKLAAPQTTLLLQDKVKPSLLFDPKEASSLDRDTVFAYGCNGLDKLIQINRRFSQFELSLFNQSTITFERAVQSKLANKNLDELISKFLSLLSPYFLLRCSHEALEWLICRFRIHMFNKDSLIACILPHYHTRIFVRVLQLIDLNDETSRWHWLQSTQKSGKPLELSVLLKQFNSNPWFRRFICNLVTEIVHAYRSNADACHTVISFSTVTVYYALKINKNVDESFVTFLFPFIVDGLKSQIPSYCAGVYAILAVLVAKIKLTSDILKELLIKISDNLIPSVTKEAFELIAVIFQHQDIPEFPNRLFCAMLKIEQAPARFKQLSENYIAEGFFMGLIKKCIPATFKEALLKPEDNGKVLRFTYTIFDTVDLSDNAVITCLNTVLKDYVKSCESCKRSKDMDQLQAAGAQLLKSLETRWPSIFDNAIESTFTECSLKENKHAWALINKSVISPQHEMLPSYGLTLFLAVNHANATIREHAMKSLLQQAERTEAVNIDFTINSLLDRIADDEPKVALAILEAEDKLFLFMPRDKLFDALKSVTKVPCASSKRREVQLQALKLLCLQQYRENQKDVLHLHLFEVILPFLFPVFVQDMDYFHCIMNSMLVEKNLFIGAIKKLIVDDLVVSNNKDLVTLNNRVLKALLTCLRDMTETTYESVFTHFVSNLDLHNSESMVCVFSVFLCLQMRNVPDVKKCKSFMSALPFLKSLASSKKVSADGFDGDLTEDMIMEKCLQSFQKKLIPFSFVMFGFRKLLENINFASKLTQSYWWPDIKNEVDENNIYFLFVVKLFVFFVEQSNNCSKRIIDEHKMGYKALLSQLIKNCFVSKNHLLWFLSFFWSKRQYSQSDLLMSLSSLKIATVFSENSVHDFLFQNSSKLFPTIFVALVSSSEEERASALDFLRRCTECQSKPLPLSVLSKEICNHYEAIKNDCSQLIEVVDAWLSPAYDVLNTAQTKNVSERDLGLSSVEVFNYLKTVIFDSSTPCDIRKVLLLILRNADVRLFMNDYLCLLDYYHEKFSSSVCDETELCIFQLLIDKYTPSSAVSLTENSKFLSLYLKLLQLVFKQDGKSNTIISEMVLRTLSKEFFFAIPSTVVQQNLMDSLVDLYINSKLSEKVQSLAKKILKKLCTSAYLLLQSLPKEKATESITSLREAKKSRMQSENVPTSNILTQGDWKKITVILEIIQSKKNLNNKEVLVPELFRLLHHSLDWENQPSVEYFRQLVLSSIFNCCKAIDVEKLNEQKFQIELVIQCIRTSDNPKTHHQALLLLNLAATIFPEHLLRNVMSIFTFMGKNLIRQDDGYSFQIISQTIETIVPALLQASKQQEVASNQADGVEKSTNTTQVVATIIRKFVNSLPDIPSHRQLPLFIKLISTFESSEYLWIPLAQICERFAPAGKLCKIYTKHKKHESKEENLPSTLEFAMNFHQQFPLNVQLNTCLHLVNHLAQLPLKIEKEHSTIEKSTDELNEPVEPLDLPSCTDEKLQDYKQNLLCYINLWLSSQTFINQVTELEPETLYLLEPQYKSLHASTLEYLQNVNDALAENPPNQRVLNLLHELLRNINSHLPCRIFYHVIKSLIGSTLPTVQGNALDLLNFKLEHSPRFFSQSESQKDLLKLLKRLLKITKKSFALHQDDDSEESVFLIQKTLRSFELLCKLIGNEHQNQFHKVLPMINLCFEEGKKNVPLLVCSLSCFSELCTCLNALMLPSLNSFMPKLLNLMQDYKLLDSNRNVIFALVNAVHSLVKNLGSFLSSYMHSLLTNISILATKYNVNSKKDLQVALDATCVLISREITPRVLIMSVHQSYEKLLDLNFEAVGTLVSILGKRISGSKHTELEDFSSELQKFYLKILNFRCDRLETTSPQSCSVTSIDAVEKEIIDSLIIFVLKLSEPTFYSFFDQICKWAISSDLGEEEDESSKLRILTFYRLTCELAKTLKTLFVPFVKKFVRHAAVTMDALNSSKSEALYFEDENTSILLLKYIIGSLFFCFKHDNNQLGEKNFFNVLMQSLVDQIENELGDDVAYQDRIQNHLSMCVACFMNLFSDSSLWKPLNYQVLLKTRHSSAKVRFGALQVIREIVKQMSDNYLVLLPESIPFLAEIMEDESFAVEQECQEVIADMEKILGEPIKKYF